MSSPGPNWRGFTKIETATKSRSSRARRMRDRWPSWRQPIVGTSPTDRPEPRAASDTSRKPAAGRITPRGPAPPRRRAGGRGPRSHRLHVVDGGSHERPEQLERALHTREPEDPLRQRLYGDEVVRREHRRRVVQRLGRVLQPEPPRSDVARQPLAERVALLPAP